MALILAVDLETTGFLQPKKPLDDQPHIVEVGAILFDDADGEDYAYLSVLVRPEGWTMPKSAERVHGISDRGADRRGVPKVAALGLLINLAKISARVCAFNADFERRVVAIEIERLNRPDRSWTRPGLEFVDLMKLSAPALKIPSAKKPDGYKWPSLAEALDFFQPEGRVSDDHRAFADATNAKALYREMLRRGLIAPWGGRI